MMCPYYGHEVDNNFCISCYYLEGGKCIFPTIVWKPKRWGKNVGMEKWG